MACPLDTEDWKLAAWIEWKPKGKSCTCPTCHGNGEVGGGFKSLDEASVCPKCFGATTVTVYPVDKDKPEIPPALIEHMRKAWIAYFEKEPTK